MQRAEYVYAGINDPSELRHSALNFDLYTHFTSPIRRYPDLVVHRQLKYIINKRNETSNQLSVNDISGYDRHIEHFNEKYINGKLISTKCQKVFHCILLRNSPVEKYKALIVDINYKSNNKNKRNATLIPGNFNTEPTLSVSIFIPKLNIEIVIYFLI